MVLFDLFFFFVYRTLVVVRRKKKKRLKKNREKSGAVAAMNSGFAAQFIRFLSLCVCVNICVFMHVDGVKRNCGDGKEEAKRKEKGKKKKLGILKLRR